MFIQLVAHEIDTTGGVAARIVHAVIVAAAEYETEGHRPAGVLLDEIIDEARKMLR